MSTLEAPQIELAVLIMSSNISTTLSLTGAPMMFSCLVESALVRHPAVAEAAVVGKPHEITGQAVACFVTLKKGNWDHQVLAEDLRKWVAHEIGSFAKPEQIRFTDALPKTRSGKIMRRLLREIVTSNSVTGDVTTLEDLSVVTRLASQNDEE